MVHLVTHPTYLACQAAQILLRHTAGLHAALVPSPSFRPPRLHTAPQLPRFSGCMLPLPYLPLPARVTPPRSFTLTLLCPPACMQVGKVGITLCLGRARRTVGGARRWVFQCHVTTGGCPAFMVITLIIIIIGLLI